LGRLGRTKGLSGEIYLDLYNPESDTLKKGSSVRVGSSPTEAQALEVKEIRVQSGRRALRFSGIGTVEEAKALVGLEIYIPRKDLAPLKKGEYYVSDIVGLRVESAEGEELGTLTSVMPTSANDVYVVKGPGGERLLPAIRGVIVKVDLENGKLIVNPPEEIDAF
jgi:16S rRNA processing protein RimM